MSFCLQLSNISIYSSYREGVAEKKKLLMFFFYLIVLQEVRVVLFPSSFEMPFNCLEILFGFELFGFICARFEEVSTKIKFARTWMDFSDSLRFASLSFYKNVPTTLIWLVLGYNLVLIFIKYKCFNEISFSFWIKDKDLAIKNSINSHYLF